MNRGARDRLASATLFAAGVPATLAIPFIAACLAALASPSGLSSSLRLLPSSLGIALIALSISSPVGIGTALFSSEFLKQRQRRVASLLLEGLGALPPVCAAWFASVMLAPWWNRVWLPLLVLTLLLPGLATLLALLSPRLPPHVLDSTFGLPTALLFAAVLLAGMAASPLLPSDAPWLPPLHSPFGAGLAISLFLTPKVAARSLLHLGRVPASLREASLGCGATRWETARRVVLPQAVLPLLFTQIELLAWAAGEVMVVLVLCGSPAQSPWQGGTLASSLVLGLPETAAGSPDQGALLCGALILLVLSVLAQLPGVIRERNP